MGERQYDIVVGVDFGTTASAIGYYIPSLFHDMKVIEAEGRPEMPEKIPSVLAYAECNPGLKESSAWGFSALSYPNVSSWFKLYFDGDIDISSWLSETESWASSQGIMFLPDAVSPEDAFCDYLGALRFTILECLKSELAPYGMSLETTTIKFCLTMPGHWSQKRKGDMEDAIKNAEFGKRKFDDFFILSEAEAAMIFALLNFGDAREASSLNLGDRVVVCDCGGGTVDVASFLISEHSPFVYDELISNPGASSGSTSVDKGFYRLMQHRFGHAFSSLPSETIGLSSRFINDFEKVKRAFTGHQNGIFLLHLDMNLSGLLDSEWYDQDSKSVILSSTDLRKLFEPAVKTIIDCLSHHIYEPNPSIRHSTLINNIVLVGGFSQSEFLQGEITRAFGDTPIIMSRTNSLTAVLRGAIAWGSDRVQLRSMRSPCHYGFSALSPVRSAPQPIILLTGGYQVSTLSLQNHPIEWIVKKDDRLQLDETIECSGTFVYQEGESSIKTIDIFNSGRDDPPITANMPGSVKVRTVAIDLSLIDLSRCEQVLGGTSPACWVNYTISACLGTSNGNIHFGVACEGTIMASWDVRPWVVRD